MNVLNTDRGVDRHIDIFMDDLPEYITDTMCRILLAAINQERDARGLAKCDTPA